MTIYCIKSNAQYKRLLSSHLTNKLRPRQDVLYIANISDLIFLNENFLILIQILL